MALGSGIWRVGWNDVWILALDGKPVAEVIQMNHVSMTVSDFIDNKNRCWKQ